MHLITCKIYIILLFLFFDIFNFVFIRLMKANRAVGGSEKFSEFAVPAKIVIQISQISLADLVVQAEVLF